MKVDDHNPISPNITNKNKFSLFKINLAAVLF